jgi:hypothetical protein
MIETPGKSDLKQPRRLRYRQFSGVQLALIWVLFAVFVLLVFVLADGRPVNWWQGVVTALVSATAVVGITAWRMRQGGEQRSPDDALKR